MNRNDEILRRVKERELDIVQLFFHILYKWRVILLCIIGLTGLVYGMLYIRDRRMSKDAVEAMAVRSVMDSFTEQELRDIETAHIYQKQIDTKLAYQRESILHNLDAYNKNVVVLQYYIDTYYAGAAYKDYSTELVILYTTYVESGAYLKDYIDWEDDIKYLAPLITVGERHTSGELKKYAHAPFISSFIIYVTGKDSQQASQLADVIEKCIVKYKEQVSKQVGGHSLNSVNRFESVNVDTFLAGEQTALTDSIIDIQNKLADLMKNFTLEQERAFYGILEPIEKVTTSDLQYLILAAAAGMLLAVILIVAGYIASGSIKTVTDLQTVFGIRIFGTITAQRPGRFTFVDRLIDRVAGKKWNEDEQIKMAVANLLITCKKENIHDIFLATSLSFGVAEKTVVANLINECWTSSIKVTYGEDVIRNVDSFQKMVESAHMVLLEMVEKTTYKELLEELILCGDQHVNVMGAIVLEKK